MRFCGVLLALALAGCLPANEPGARQERPARAARTGNPWVDCYRRFEPTSDAVNDLERLGAACAARAGMRALGPIHDGAEQRGDGQPERFVFQARAGRCYRAFAVGGPGVEDLDLAVYGPDGKLAAADVSRDRWPVVPPRGPACADRDGLYTVAISVARGAGPYVVQVWGADQE